MRVYYNDRHRSHAPQRFLARGRSVPCPETPERADVLEDAVRAAGHEILPTAGPDLEAIRAVHASGYLEFLESAWERWRALEDPGEEIIPNVHPGRHMHGRPESVVGLAGYYQADCACPLSAGSWAGSLAATEAAVTAADAVLGPGPDHAYALCRPPGHHAFSDMAGGFCLLNNTAIAVERCRSLGAGRVAVLDVDVHHGNGTQEIFYSRPDVLTVSLHGDPAEFYPFFAGYADEVGTGAGRGFNHNHPLARGTGDDAYLERLGQAFAAVEGSRPEVLVVALGLDASEHDPLAFLAVTTDGFRRIGAAIGALGLPTVLVQEGGYLSPTLGANLQAVLEGFEGARPAGSGGERLSGTVDPGTLQVPGNAHTGS